MNDVNQNLLFLFSISAMLDGESFHNPWLAAFGASVGLLMWRWESINY